jgi:hypothetical protein
MMEANSSPYLVDTGNQTYQFALLPKYSGSYRIGGIGGIGVFSISIVNKPNWFHRKMMALCLGWEWQDGPPL